MEFCLILEILNLINYSGGYDVSNKLVIFSLKSGIGLKYQVATGSVLKAIGEELEGVALDQLLTNKMGNGVSKEGKTSGIDEQPKFRPFSSILP